MVRRVNQTELSVVLLAVLLLAATGIAGETAAVGALAEGKKVVCYVGTWAVYRPGNGRFDIEHIDPYLCTHLMYGFFGINEDATVRVIDPYLDLEENWGRGHIKRFVGLKHVSPTLKTLAAIGGWNEGSRKFSQMAASAALRKRFIYDCVAFCQRHGFDGIDLDWEYPAQRDGNPAIDRDNHAQLVEEMRVVFDQYGLLLTAAVASVEFSAGLSYDIPRISKSFHFLNVMVYDMHGAWESYCGINAPLYRGSADKTETEQQLNVNASIHYWLSQGAPAEKLVLGIPLYGRSFTLANAENSQIGAPAVGGGTAGPYTRQSGVMGYNEFCEKLQTESWDLRWDIQQRVPYAVRGNQWLGYDDLQSIQLKVRYLLDYGLGGAMVWSLETDDFRGVCGGGNYPLMREIRSLVDGGAGSPTTLPPPTVSSTSTSTTTSTNPTTTTTSNPGSGNPGTTTSNPGSGNPGTTSPPASERPCSGGQTGFVPHPNYCNKYYMCLTGDMFFEFTCPAGTLFDPNLNVCNWADQVKCAHE
ncbi:chitotriosidase-1-like [Anopheles stephensi]|uniref:chitotriosidase-1-like n=1 Tax=Anopheles stephensi TaxID=30069 RepID=UPI001658BC9D|nr:chitotriosidase-1-like [Anopheles stephensi]